MNRYALSLLLSAAMGHCAWAQLTVDGRQAFFDKQTDTFLATVPESVFNSDAVLTVKPADGYSQLTIDGQPLEGETYTFHGLSAAATYPIALRNQEGQPVVASLRFTFLPTLKLSGTFGNSYSQGTLLLCDPEKDTTETLDANIKWRGGTTNRANRHKRNYKIKLGDDKSLLGLRNDNNWILDAGQADVFRLRNRVAMDIWNDMASPVYYADREPKARSGISGRVTEVFLNDEYVGIYNFSENLDRKQMKLKKVSDLGTQVNGCLYKSKGWSYSMMFDSLAVPYDNAQETWNVFEVKYPDLADCDTTDWSTLYQAIDFVVSSSDSDFRQHVAEYFDLPPFIDYCIFCSALNAIDNYAKNMFWAVYDKNTDKKLTVAAWDLDCTVGQRWAAKYNMMFPSPLYMFDSFMGLPYRLISLNVDHFVEKMNDRYAELRKGILSTNSLKARYEHYYNLIANSGAAERETAKWSGDSDIEGEAIDFPAELDYIKNWITQHLRMIDIKKFPLTIEVNMDAISSATMPVRQTDTLYDLQGRPVDRQRAKKGIYLVNGRKRVIR